MQLILRQEYAVPAGRRALKSAELFNLFVARSVRVADHEAFTLASGKKSRYYIDCKATLLHPEGLALAGAAVWELIRDQAPDCVGGLTLGADPITLSVCLAARSEGKSVLPLIVRKEAKGHGTGKWIEGLHSPGMRVVVVDDVFTTGGSTLKAIDRMQEAGLEVVEAVALVDRNEGAAENFAARGIAFRSLFRLEELLTAAAKSA